MVTSFVKYCRLVGHPDTSRLISVAPTLPCPNPDLMPACPRVDKGSRQRYSCVMMPPFEPSGDLPPGIHWAEWDEFSTRFGTTPHRRRLLAGLKAALDALQRAGCQRAYIDGSLVTAKAVPGDFDACWDMAGVDANLLDPVLLTFDPGRVTQKAKYLGELFPSSTVANLQGNTFLEFFQVNKETGLPKGIVALDLWRLP